jgi:hypothetical protein
VCSFPFLYSIQELRKGIAQDLLEDSEDRETDSLVSVLELAQKYASCITPSGTRGQQLQQRRRQSAAVIAVSWINDAWEALCRYRSIQYKIAYRSFHSLRRQRSLMKGRCLSGGDVVERSRRLQSVRAEQLCACQRGLIVAQTRERQLQQ